jgi:hypothetical protein
MGKAIPTQHPAVVLRSHYQQLRALLAILMIAVVGLSAAVVILATNDDRDTSASSATQVIAPGPTGNTRYDGGPEEGTRGVVPAPLPQANATALPQRMLDGATDSTRYDGGPEEGTRGTVPAVPSGSRSDGGPDEGSHGLTGKSYSD